MQTEREITAIHEAAHAIMSFMKGCLVSELRIFENPSDDGLAGHCTHAVPDYWRDRVWITLAGPVATALHEGRSEGRTFTYGDQIDHEKCFGLLLDFVKPDIPSELLPFLEPDLAAEVEWILDGHYPEDVSGPLKGKLTRFCKRCDKSIKFAIKMLKHETKLVRYFIQTSPIFMTLTHRVADELNRKGKMDSKDILLSLKAIAGSEELKLKASEQLAA